jgi:hypothetical protein
MVAVGKLKSADTVVEAELEQPLFVLVMTNVYVPAASTVGVSVPAPAAILPLGVVHW